MAQQSINVALLDNNQDNQFNGEDITNLILDGLSAYDDQLPSENSTLNLLLVSDEGGSLDISSYLVDNDITPRHTHIFTGHFFISRQFFKGSLKAFYIIFINWVIPSRHGCQNSAAPVNLTGQFKNFTSRLQQINKR